MKTKITLVSYTADPMETLYKIWKENRDPNVQVSIPEVRINRKKDPALNMEVERIFKALISSDISVIQNIHFTFKLENISIALREQLVRHRIGVAWDARLGVDYVPDLTDDGIWIQSMRVLDMGSFYDRCAYEVPEEIDNEQKRYLYEDAMYLCQNTYKRLCEMGVPRETARMVLPLACQHDMFWTLNLGALCHILRKRGCWIPQFGLWKPIIVGMIQELAMKIHPVFRSLTQPPCMQDGKFTGCHFPEDIARRLDHSDPLPPCPLACSGTQIADWAQDKNTVNTVMADDVIKFNSMIRDYTCLWGFNPLKDVEDATKNENKNS